MQEILRLIAASPVGISAGELARRTQLSRATINRRIKEALGANLILAKGAGAARVYLDADPLRPIREYFVTPHTERPFARFREALLDYTPSLAATPIIATRDFSPLEKRDLVQFLVDFSCASSVLEGGTYSLLDTQALIEYGEKAEGKSLADAFLVLNHKNAFEYLYDKPSLTSIYEVHKRLTDDHGLRELQSAPHFLKKEQQGVLREYEDINITLSSYAPPLRPGTGFIQKMLDRILATSAAIDSPLESAFYLLTRLPYLQAFVDGNKRTSRALCNVPLLSAGMPPLSFIDFGKRDYILSLLAFYELGDTRFAASMFNRAYQRSCDRMRSPSTV